MYFNELVNSIELNKYSVHGLEVYLNGGIVHSYGDTQDKRYPIYSATKTITSIAVGMAVDEKKLSIDKPILFYIPESVRVKLPTSYIKVYETINIIDLLTMSVKGFPFRPKGDSWLKDAFSYPVNVPGDGKVYYSNISAYLVGVATSYAVGEHLYEYLNRKLFAPLGIVNPAYGSCPDGYFYGASHMKLTVNELSRIGLLLYNKGMFENKRILSEEYIANATCFSGNNHVAFDGGSEKKRDYGYLIWSYRDSFSMNGKWGQKCLILPEQKKVITYLSSMENNSEKFMECIEKYLL